MDQGHWGLSDESVLRYPAFDAIQHSVAYEVANTTKLFKVTEGSPIELVGDSFDWCVFRFKTIGDARGFAHEWARSIYKNVQSLLSGLVTREPQIDVIYHRSDLNTENKVTLEDPGKLPENRLRGSLTSFEVSWKERPPGIAREQGAEVQAICRIPVEKVVIYKAQQYTPPELGWT